LNRLLTRDKLIKLGIQVDNALCAMCNSRKKNVSHLFFTCSIVGKIWSICETWLGVQFVHHNMPKQHFLGFTLTGLDKRGRCVWKMLWMTMVCGIFGNTRMKLFLRIENVT